MEKEVGHDLLIWMYGNYLSGRPVTDFGQVQYKYCERNGLLLIDAYMEFKSKAAEIEVSRSLGKMKKDEHQDTAVINTAKLLCLRDLFSRIKHSRKPITDYLCQ